MSDSAGSQQTISNANALVIFAKYPEPGQVKTRLGKTIGDERAAALYRAFLADLAARFSNAAPQDGYDLYWACQPEMRPLAEIVGPQAQCFDQRGATLDERLANVCADLRAQGYSRAVILGSDAPHLPTALVRDAFARLAAHDAVFGPAEDGGYYLVGLRLEPEPPDLFSGIQMSTASVLAETLQRAELQRLTVALLPTLFDIDEAADLPRLAALLGDGTYEAPQTRAVLRQLITTYRGFLEEVNAAFAAPGSDPQAWAEAQEERAAWDATLADDLEEKP